MSLSPTHGTLGGASPFDFEALRDQIIQAFNPDQPRVPAGNPGGGEFAKGGALSDTEIERRLKAPSLPNLFKQPSSAPSSQRSSTPEEQAARIQQVKDKASSDPEWHNAAQAVGARGEHRDDPGVMKDGLYTPSAQAENDRIASEFLTSAAQSRSGEQPVAVFLVGKPGAGKSGLIAKLQARGDLPPTVPINADLVQEKLPGYTPGLTAAYHERACDIARNCLTPAVLAGRYNAYFDTTDGADRLEKTARQFKDAGYHIVVVHADVDTATSVERVYNRFRQDGRYIPLDIVEGYGEKPKNAYERLKASGLADEWREYDTTAEGFAGGQSVGQPARVVEKGARSSRQILSRSRGSVGAGAAGRGRAGSRDIARRARAAQARVALLAACNEWGILGDGEPEITSYNPDQARDSAGKWTSGGSEPESWVGFDLDGTLAEYHGWKGSDHIGAPIPQMVRIIKKHLADGDKVKIFTARVANDPKGVAKQAIEKWCVQHLGQKLPVTCVKDSGMTMLYDDRAVAVVRNDGTLLNDPSEIEAKCVACECGDCVIHAYSEDEARDEHGRWTAGMEENLAVMSRTSHGTGREPDRPALAESGDALAEKANQNFREAADWVWQHRDQKLDSGATVRHTIEKLGSIVNQGLLAPGQSPWRTWNDSAKGYIPVERMMPRLYQFCDQLAARMKAGDDPKSTAAFVEHEFNAEIHPLADGMGRTTMLLAGMTLLQNGHELPRYGDRAAFYKGITSPGWEGFYHSLFGVQAFSPDEARDAYGRWTTGGDVYVSPNVEENTKFDEAVKQVDSDRQKNFVSLAHRVCEAVLGQSEVNNAVGAWADGAENSTHITSHTDNVEDLKYAGALLAKAAQQKAFLWFRHDPAGGSLLYTIRTEEDLSTIEKRVRGVAALENHTLVPHSWGTEIQVFDKDGSSAEAIGAFSAAHGYRTTAARGEGNFEGSWTSREEGAKEYDRIIQDYEEAHPGRAYRDSLTFQHRGRDEEGHGSGDRGRSEAARKEGLSLSLSAHIYAAVPPSEVLRRVRALPTVPAPKSPHWSALCRTKARHYGKSVWKKNPIKLVRKPADAEAFKLLPVKLRDHLVSAAPVQRFNPRDLVTNQPVVYLADLEHFLRHGKDPEPVIVLRSSAGLYVHNGNHRSTLALLSGHKVRARYVDLAKVPEVQNRIKVAANILDAKEALQEVGV